MKNFVTALLFILLLAGTQFGISQNYMPLPDSNVQWVVADRTSETSYYLYFRVGSYDYDTVIDGYTYSKIYYSSFIGPEIIKPLKHSAEDHSRLVEYKTKIEGEYWGAYRNDGEGRVFYLPPGTSSNNDEGVLFDFTANIGDTISNVSVWFVNEMNSYVVDSTTYFEVEGETHKVIYLTNITPDSYEHPWQVWIEGVGNLLCGPFNGMQGLTNQGLICVSINDTMRFFSSGYIEDYSEYFVQEPGDCSFMLGTNEAVIQQNLFIMPNPFTKNLTIQGVNSGIVQFKLLNVSGQEVFSSKVFHEGGDITFSLESVSPGIYLCNIQNNKRVWNQKIVKY